MATTVAPRFGSADDFWREIDEAVVGCIASGETMPSEIGRGLGLSESAVCSIVAMLAIEGRVRTCRVVSSGELTRDG